MKYSISWGEEKTAGSGVKYYRADMKDEQGKEYKGVAVFSSFKGFDRVQPGAIVEGKITSKDYKGQPSYTLENDIPAGGFNKGGNMGKMMETKQANILEAQGNKELGIKISSTMRDAVLITATQLSADMVLSKDPSAIKKMIKDWRKFLWEEWDKTNADFEPFPSEPVINLDDDGFANF